MRKTVYIIIALVLSFGLAGCGGSDSSGGSLYIPSFDGDRSPAAINSTNAQAIVDAAMSVTNINNAVDESMSFLFYFEPGEVFNGIDNQYSATSATTGVVNGCGGGGNIGITGLTANLNGGSLTGAFNNYVPYDPNSFSSADCLSSVEIESGSIYLSITDNTTWDWGCLCWVGTSSGNITMTGMKITKAGVSNITFDGTILSSTIGTTSDETETTTQYTRMTDNNGTAGINQTMLTDHVEVSTETFATNTETTTDNGTLYTPKDGALTLSTLTPLEIVGFNSPSAGQYQLTGADSSFILINASTSNWSAEFSNSPGPDATGTFLFLDTY